MTAAALAAGLALAAAPQRLALAPAAHAALTVRNFGSRPATVALAVVGYRLDLRGRARIGGPAHGWVQVAPRRLRIAPHGTATVDVTAAAPRHAPPGDHSVVVTLTGSATTAGAHVVLRLGVVVAVRVPGRVVRRVALGRLVVAPAGKRRVVTLGIRNAGNVDLWLGRRALVVRALRGHRTLAVWSAAARRLLARSVAAYTWRVPPRLRNTLVLVDVRVRAGTAQARRRYHLRL